eukprot:TRINITY_DN2925_c0_g1_i1.p1 TRINITY_DN2925_c0_g1~~TRINITY_DN2925_c0_g1_i1.p1  ORF type:complete len:130 (+),score=36.43 TRINITY_DN2925_c0_g1_i1:143-532(+)
MHNNKETRSIKDDIRISPLMDLEIIKHDYECVCKLINDEKRLNEMVDLYYKVVEKARAGTLTIEELEKDMNRSMEMNGMKSRMPRDALEKSYERFTSEEAKASTREEIDKTVREKMKANKAMLEDMMKK